MVWVVMLLTMCVSLGHGEYNGECWIVSSGMTVYRLHANGEGDPTAIENLTNASDVQVNPTKRRWSFTAAVFGLFFLLPPSQVSWRVSGSVIQELSCP